MRAHPGHETRSQRQSTQCLPAELQEIEPDLAGACIQALPARAGKPPLRHHHAPVDHDHHHVGAARSVDEIRHDRIGNGRLDMVLVSPR